jgi:broad specificity phosphatase PhoE
MSEEGKIQFRNPTVLLVEHGSTEFSAQGDKDRIHGTKFDLPLTKEGRRQAERAAEILADYDIATLEHSPMLRATQTAKIISQATGVKAVPNVKLLPWDSGFVSGMTHGAAADIIEYYVRNPHKVIRDGKAYGGWYDVYSEALREKMKQAESMPGQAYVLGVHSSEVSTAPAVIKGDPADFLDEQLPGSGQIAALEKRGGRWRFIKKFA